MSEKEGKLLKTTPSRASNIVKKGCIRRIGARFHLRLKGAVQDRWDDWVLNAPRAQMKETINERINKRGHEENEGMKRWRS